MKSLLLKTLLYTTLFISFVGTILRGEPWESVGYIVFGACLGVILVVINSHIN